ncbi:autophagy protein 12-like isoform X1 [Halyomorpha halys]|uniref:autophagy protein 12-like isoform X1 n=1 Tax=Halyomorpha halys TaxID=286706 RepID=UPI0006D4DE29|nr:autophagy protein 12-like isoform X1 [Halyomorpha halys]
MSESETKEGINDPSDNPKDVDASSENSENIGITSQGGDSTVPKKNKVDIFLKATANAPIMKRRKWTVDHDKTIAWIIAFLRKYFKLDANESLFLYVNQSFAPSPDQVVRNLYECFGTDGKLILHYCQTQAWG